MPLEVSGFSELVEDLLGMADELEGPLVDEALEAGAEPVQEKMTAFAPDGPTHRLKPAIATGGIKVVNGRKRITIGVHKTAQVPHADWVEHGHGGPHPAPPHPYAQPAFDATKDQAYNNIRQKLAEGLRGQ